jgi:hypothetical protein
MAKHFFLISFLFLCFSRDGHTNDSIKVKPFQYINIGSGFSHATYRDMGVSPLVYSGAMPVFALGYRVTRPQFFMDTDAAFSFGQYQRKTDGMTFKTNAYNVNFCQNYYRNIHSIRDQLFFFMGAGASYLLSARISPQYMNSQFVMNNIFNLSMTGRMQFNFSLPEHECKFLFIKCRKIEKHYTLAMNIGIPFASIGHYPGFSYVSHATVNRENEFENYKWHLHIFSGINTRLEFLRFLENGNALGLTYNFHIFSNKSYLSNYLQMADQSVSFSLLYRFQ